MDKNSLLRSIAETGYNVGYGAKQHFATYDVVEKVPGYIGFVSLAFGVYGLVFETLTGKALAATLVVVGIIGLYVAPYDGKKREYEAVGRDLTQIFNRLRDLYRTVSDWQSDDLSAFQQQLRALETEYYAKSFSKQVLLSDWYAHYKFFWQHQIDWIDEQKKFKLLRDKIPLTFYVFLLAVAGLIVYLARRHFLR